MAGFNPNVNNGNSKPYLLVDRLHSEPDKEKYPNAKSFDEKEPDFGEERKAVAIEKAKEIADKLAEEKAFAEKNIIGKDGEPKKVTANKITLDGHSFKPENAKDENDKMYSFTITVEGKTGGLRAFGAISTNKEGQTNAYINSVKYSDHPQGETIKGAGEGGKDKYIAPKWVDCDEKTLEKAKLTKVYEVVSSYVHEKSDRVAGGFPQIYESIRDHINDNVPKDMEVPERDENGNDTGNTKNVREIYVGSYKVDGDKGSFYINTHSPESIKVTVDVKTGDYSLDIVTKGEDKTEFTKVEDLSQLDNVKGGKLVQEAINLDMAKDANIKQNEAEKEDIDAEVPFGMDENENDEHGE